MKTSIELTGMKFYAYHGVLSQEQKVGNWFSVDLALSVDFTSATYSDRLEDTINYAHVHELVEKEMNTPSQLIEHVAGRILQSLEKSYPTIQAIRIKVTKIAPPFKGQLDGVSVVIEKRV
ncbi:dihydroneopterin aldolase [Porphyromonas circumdentaria]|nr:dihydroneopterin aldolase [Porphyromonas circumdentaria]MBB6276266.1 dihydroneopterin aldolase [Porphyromonas circumdentaria]MDO4722262.1 dihydroneopterin aldolase [Porphyromonas circumdentaria]